MYVYLCVEVKFTEHKAFESEQYSDTHHVMQPPPLPSSRTLSPPGKETLNPLCSLPGAAVAKYYKLGWLKTSLGLLNQCVFTTGLPLRLGFCHTSVCISHRHGRVPTLLNPFPPPSPPHPSRLSQSTGFGCPAPYIKLPLAVLRMAMSVFQCYSLKSSHSL